VTLLWLLCLPALLYQLLSLFASLRQVCRKPRPSSYLQKSALRVPRIRELPQVSTSQYLPPISLLKPVRGVDPDMYAAFVSQALQDYPDFEIIFGVADEGDGAVPQIRRLQREFPNTAIKLIIGSEPAANAKAGVLARLAKHARYPIWLVNDSDIRVTPSYLQTVVAPLEDKTVGVVTCLYRPESFSAATAWESFGIAVDFMPSTLVAQVVGVKEFGLGSTLCFRADDLRSAGGFEAIADYIADDYQLASRIVHAGKTAQLSTYIVDTSLGEGSWGSVWQHQLRWARTIRSSKGAGFSGLVVTHAGAWAVVALLLHLWSAAAALAGLRIIAALASGWLVIKLKRTPLWAALAPVWDIYAFAVWVVSYASNEVRWRDRKLTIGRGGKLWRDK
jgi:ceramide glucosyltransferase